MELEGRWACGRASPRLVLRTCPEEHHGESGERGGLPVHSAWFSGQHTGEAGAFLCLSSRQAVCVTGAEADVCFQRKTSIGREWRVSWCVLLRGWRDVAGRSLRLLPSWPPVRRQWAVFSGHLGRGQL